MLMPMHQLNVTCTWNFHLVLRLNMKLQGLCSLIDQCVFCHDDIIFIIYVDNGLFFGNCDITLTLIISQLKSSGLNIEYQGLQLTMLESTSKRLVMEPTNLSNTL
ncbi:hypothetical protein ACHAW6_003317 [Cyclotella cf. meneghiniana]